jgi:hypothetical protein
MQDCDGKREEEKLLGKPRHKWEDNIKMNIKIADEKL